MRSRHRGKNASDVHVVGGIFVLARVTVSRSARTHDIQLGATDEKVIVNYEIAS